MTIVRCPRCRDEVTAPAKASPKALVRCPLCLEEYLLSDALAGVPPALIVVGGEAEEGTYDEAGGSEYRLSGGAFSGVFDASAPADAAVAPARPAVAGAARPRKQEKKKSAVVELVKIVLGGVVGLAIGLVVLWWGFGQDPLELGPKVAKYAPQIVPAKFHGKSKSSDSEATAAPSKSPNTNGAVAASGKKQKVGKVPASEEPPLTSAGEELDRLAKASEPAGFDSGLLQPLPGNGKGGKIPEPTLDIPLDLPKPAAANLDLPLDLPPVGTLPQKDAADFAAAPAPSAAPPMPDLTDLLPDGVPPAELTPAEARHVPSAEAFAQAIAAASNALAKYEGLPKDEAEARREAFTSFYRVTGEVGRVISFLNPADAELSADVVRLQELLDAISGAKGSSKLNPIKFLASQQWPTAKQDEGMLVAGTVKEIRSVGRLFEITLDASGRSEFILPVLTTTNPDELCAVGDSLVVVGRILSDPQKNLPGYEGEPSRVLLLGYSIRAPKVE